MPRGGVRGNKGGGNKGASGQQGNSGNKGGSGSPGNKGGAPAQNVNASSAQTKAHKLVDHGVELHRQGDLTGALVSYEAALKIDPDLRVAHNHIGLILANRHLVGDVLAGSYSAILEHLEKAADLGDLDARRNLCKLRFVGEHGTRNDAEAKLDDCQYFIKNLKPVTAGEHHMFGRCAWVCSTQETDDGAFKLLAEEHYRLAVAGDPSSSLYRTTLACFLKAHGKLAEAAVVFVEVLRSRPNYQFAKFMLENVLAEVPHDISASAILD